MFLAEGQMLGVLSTSLVRREGRSALFRFTCKKGSYIMWQPVVDTEMPLPFTLKIFSN